ncbi:putative tyrosinase-like protein tyr-1 [Hydractinia symbiolongicarpus]|uniref:putative tyrosinase-like protein tyr-1 n=1 Tax=Hydractinia symbiolongicarpus TaxID=13093 RepID=UPI00254A706C|nr:putative tyrosinase-like protein tyr-1 [Hydractinia symbiolongicarpus]
MNIIFTISLLLLSISCTRVFSAALTDSTSNSKNKTACEDHKECNYYWSRGWYTCAVGAVLYDYCPKSCGYCDKDPYPTPRPGELCKDYEPLCKNWAKYRECIYAQKFTEKYCPKSCGLCPEDRKKQIYNQFCVDSTNLCQSKAKSYGCLFQRKFMSKYCKKICKMCSSYSRCNDEDSLCNWWKQRGYCSLKNYKDYMKKNCRYSCDLCYQQQ